MNNNKFWETLSPVCEKTLYLSPAWDPTGGDDFSVHDQRWRGYYPSVGNSFSVRDVLNVSRNTFRLHDLFDELE